MVIPAQAVEAALKVFYTETNIGYIPSGIITSALKAAAPHIERAALMKAGVIAKSRDSEPTP